MCHVLTLSVICRWPNFSVVSNSFIYVKRSIPLLLSYRVHKTTPNVILVNKTQSKVFVNNRSGVLQMKRCTVRRSWYCWKLTSIYDNLIRISFHSSNQNHTYFNYPIKHFLTDLSKISTVFYPLFSTNGFKK